VPEKYITPARNNITAQHCYAATFVRLKPIIMEQTLQIKGMVCNRCIMTVEAELLAIGHTPLNMSLGKVSYTPNEMHESSLLEERLSSLGFSVLKDKNTEVTTQIKNIIEEVYSGDFDFPDHFRLSELIRNRLGYDYDKIRSTFIAHEKKTIEQYSIDYRINKVKEYLVYTDYTLADIAFRLNYNSVGHLSNQFKQLTGLTPSFFKSIKRQKAETSCN
jgi:AraC family transcriptional regulator